MEAIKQRDHFKKQLDCGKVSRDIFNAARTKVVRLISKAKSQSIKKELEENKRNSRLLWKALKKLNPTGKSKSTEASLDGNEHQKLKEKANSFNSHFISIASSIIQESQPTDVDLSHIKTFVDERKPDSVDFKIPLLDAKLLNELIKSLPSNVATGLDGVSAPLLKLIAPTILDSIVKVMNCSIQSGICPAALKMARVTPVHKAGSNTDPNNFRPISVLPIISKLLERHVCNHLTNYLRSYKLIISTQSGFRSQHSTESILIKMTDDWLEAMDRGELTGVIYLDLRKAFDVVNHDLLLTKLQMYGFSPSALRWFKSYLTDRYQQVSLNGVLSDAASLRCGVPQGSILGPSLFLLFINDLPLSWKNENGIFADDATFYASAQSLSTIQDDLQRDLASTAKWTKEHGMVAHPEKTKYMIIGTNQKISHCKDCSLSLWLNDKQLQQTHDERLLGVDIDPKLTWSTHVENLRKKLLKRIAVLARIKKLLPIKYRIILFNASIKPILEYCVSVWGNCNAGLLDDLFKLQKRCARIILNESYQSRSLSLFVKLGWTPINHICIAKRLILFKKITDKRAPDYLTKKLSSFEYLNHYNTRRQLPYHLPIPKTNSMKRSFFYSTIKTWTDISKSVSLLNEKKLKVNYDKFIMQRYTPDTFKVHRIF